MNRQNSSQNSIKLLILLGILNTYIIRQYVQTSMIEHRHTKHYKHRCCVFFTHKSHLAKSAHSRTTKPLTL